MVWIEKVSPNDRITWNVSYGTLTEKLEQFMLKANPIISVTPSNFRLSDSCTYEIGFIKLAWRNTLITD